MLRADAIEAARRVANACAGAYPDWLRPAARRVLSLARAEQAAARRCQRLAYLESTGAPLNPVQVRDFVRRAGGDTDRARRCLAQVEARIARAESEGEPDEAQRAELAAAVEEALRLDRRAAQSAAEAAALADELEVLTRIQRELADAVDAWEKQLDRAAEQAGLA